MKIQIPDVPNINILVSGGVDSTLLLYLLLKQHSGVPVNSFFMGQSDALFKNIMDPIAANIRAHLHIDFSIRIINPPVFIREAARRILDVYPGVVLTACNKVEDHIKPTVFIPGDSPPVRGPALNEFHYRPFIDLSKIEIMKIYLDEELLDLLSLTRSCGMTSGIHRCGGCYFCLERAWAAEALGLDDINKVTGLYYYPTTPRIRS